MALGPRAAVMTAGGEGAIVIEAAITHVPAVAAEVVDTTAAGDAFNGALAVALSEDVSLIEAVEFANRVAALSVQRLGAQPSLPRRDELDD